MKEAEVTNKAFSRVTVIIVTHNRPECLERCLQQLEKVKYRDYITVVADSSPSTPAAELLAAKYGAEYRSTPVKGVSRARNLGAHNARSEILAYLDDDMVPHPNWLGALAESFSDISVMAVSGPVLSLALFGSGEPELQNSLNSTPWGPRSFSIEETNPQWFERANFGGIGDGNFALRRSAFLQIRGFDERIGRGSAINTSEEHYAYYRVIDLGGKVTYLPQAIVFHQDSPICKELAQKNIRESAAYAVFLMHHHPFKTLRVLKFCVEGFFWKRRWWRTDTETQNSLSKWEILLCGWKGFCDFLRSVAKIS